VNKSPLYQILLLGMLASESAYASSFVVEDIQVRGLQRISAGTVFNYLPVTVGETFTDDKQGTAIRAL
jgi:outer membrane protein insertion porin family